MYASIISLIHLSCFALSVVSTPAPNNGPSATIDSGVVVGTATSLAGVHVNKFLGIPFAASPTRFAPPETPAPWSKPYDASKYGPACYQEFVYPEASRNATIAWFNTPPPPAGESEDCLNLNIYAPAAWKEKKGKPVMFWIYGGSLAFGANSLTAYDGTSFAANQDVIIVTTNYRTNVFGFPEAPQLPLTKRNLGFLDQRLALEWVQRNIAAFGGDPDAVTIFGESAGAASVDELVTTLADDPPFRGAIMESGQSSFYVNTDNNANSWNAMVEALNCSTAADILGCVRAVDAPTIKSVIEHLELAFHPTADNVTSLRYPERARLAGHIAQVPIMTGTNAQEGRIFVVGQNDTKAFLQASFPNLTTFQNAILQAYPLGSPGIVTQYDQIAAIETDFVFQCPAAFLANDSATHFPTWRYYFNASFANTQLFPGAGVFHSSEIPLVFGTYPRTGATTEEAQLSEYMQTSWATFAKNPAGGPGWPTLPEVAVLGSPGKGLRFDVPGYTLDARCALYKTIYQALEG